MQTCICSQFAVAEIKISDFLKSSDLDLSAVLPLVYIFCLLGPIKVNENHLLHLSHRASATSTKEDKKHPMKTNITDFILVVSVSLSLLYLKHEAHAASEQHRPTFHITATNNTLICHDNFMSVYISKEDFLHLPFSIYVLGKSDTLTAYTVTLSLEVLVVFYALVCATQMNKADITRLLL